MAERTHYLNSMAYLVSQFAWILKCRGNIPYALAVDKKEHDSSLSGLERFKRTGIHAFFDWVSRSGSLLDKTTEQYLLIESLKDSKQELRVHRSPGSHNELINPDGPTVEDFYSAKMKMLVEVNRGSILTAYVHPMLGIYWDSKQNKLRGIEVGGTVQGEKVDMLYLLYTSAPITCLGNFPMTFGRMVNMHVDSVEMHRNQGDVVTTFGRNGFRRTRLNVIKMIGNYDNNYVYAINTINERRG